MKETDERPLICWLAFHGLCMTRRRTLLAEPTQIGWRSLPYFSVDLDTLEYCNLELFRILVRSGREAARGRSSPINPGWLVATAGYSALLNDIISRYGMTY